MGNCSVCGKKLGFWEGRGNIFDSEEFCESCFNKRNEDKKKLKEEREEINKKVKEKEEFKEEHKNETEKESKNVWRILIILTVFVILVIIPLSDSNQEYKDCVKDCKVDYDFCISFSTEYSQLGNEYILGEDYEDCSYDLDSCIDDCGG